MICEFCRQHVESVNDADECETCADERFAEEHAFWGPVYEGERRAGLHGEFSEEGLEMRRREMAGVWMNGLTGSWLEDTPLSMHVIDRLQEEPTAVENFDAHNEFRSKEAKR